MKSLLSIYMDNAGLSDAALAVMVGKSRQTIYNWRMSTGLDCQYFVIFDEEDGFRTIGRILKEETVYPEIKENTDGR